MKTELKNRTLWMDGHFTVNAETISNFLQYPNVHVTQITEDVERYNFLNPEAPITVKTDIDPSAIDFSYHLPDEYKNIDVEKLVLAACQHITIVMNKRDAELRMARTRQELEMFKSKGLYNLLRTMVYITAVFEKNNTVWSGRGSSCASYLLYLLGVHDVDSVKYDIDISEFLRNDPILAP